MECSICLELLSSDYIQLECKHKFCKNCIIQNRNNNCPLCRRIYNILPNYNSLPNYNIENNDNNNYNICAILACLFVITLIGSPIIFAIITIHNMNTDEYNLAKKTALIYQDSNNIIFTDLDSASVDCLNDFNKNVKSFMSNITVNCVQMHNQMCQEIIQKKNISSSTCNNINDDCFKILVNHYDFFENKKFVC